MVGPRRAAALAVALAVGLATARRAAADDELPRGHLGLALVLRRNLGALADRYGLGYFYGVVAGYQVTRPGERIGLGVVLTTLRGSSQLFETEWSSADDPTVAGGPLSYRELGLGLRLRVALLEGVPLYLGAGGGAAVLRTSAPVPPSGDRLHLGGYAGLALEYYLGAFLFGADARYGLLGDGPRSASLIVSAGLGR